MNILNNVYNLVYFFTIYSFLGWCTEVLYYYKVEKRFVNRGFLNGPFCPIYGSSVVMLVMLLDNFKDNILMLFILSFLVTTIVEYITGFILEKLFNDKWWDYSTDPLNIHGRVCLFYSIFWGIGATLLIVFVHPIINRIVTNIPHFLGLVLFFTIIFYFLIDFAVTLSSLINFEFLMPRIEFAFNKTMLTNFNREKTTFKLKNIEYALEKFITEQKKLFKNFSVTHSKSFTNFINSLKDMIKKD